MNLQSMKGHILLVFFCLISAYASGQDQIRVRGGFLYTNTSIAEYNRDLDYFYLDSATIDSDVASPTLNIEMDIAMGKGFFLSTGLGYVEKGFPSIYYNNGDYWYDAKQKYLGIIFQLKYHYKLKNKKLGFYGAAGFKSDFAILGPNNAEIAAVDGNTFFHAFGTFHAVDFGLHTIFGLSYKLGPGDIVLDVNFINGLSDTIADRYIHGKSFSMGAALGYSIYL